ncbi:prepilin peptidase [Verrucomicrobia bacterium]|jgi:preprotein translocase subunit SecA|nr:prepilin peptidase [Verrucomicrobiota bacterium]MDA7510461.1 prepilin peptidase [Verrucomicrobiota bacterium]MDA7667881.1 prepilin peptidase [bacterium]MDA7866717.1 prepilin peptidase [Verrucomicrobiota bacterium]MDB4798640.1 prepilin peptidase [Verrucomicrobiota bacterium]
MASDSLYTLPKPRTLYRGLDSVVNGWIGRSRRRSSVVQELLTDAAQIDAHASQITELTDEELDQRLIEKRTLFRRRAKPGDEIEALALVREIAARSLGLRPFTVQLAGALALYRGYLAEMATGEGKTLTAGLAAVLLGWTGKPCHVVTVNDYLVERDADWLKPLYDRCHIRVGTVTGKMTESDRRAGHECDVTYTTSKELLADLLRDQMKREFGNSRSRRLLRKVIGTRAARTPKEVLRGIHTAIVDEADSVLVDEAVTPLIISSSKPNESLKQAILRADSLCDALESPKHYSINKVYSEIEFSAEGHAKIASMTTEWKGIWRSPSRREELVRQGIVAREFFHRDKQYLVENRKIVIIDEFTGRPMPQRSWRQGLHQAIEAKEGLSPSDPTETVARMSFQRFFRCFEKLAGMTGTGRESANEFWQIYQLPVVSLPPNRPCIREEWPQIVAKTEDQKWSLLMQEIRQVHGEGRPILIGTRNVFASEKIARLLEAENLEYQLLNASRLSEEAGIVADAGRVGRITVATNMAGRGTDIRLDAEGTSFGGLHVIGTEFHETERVDRQLFGRCARQGDPGSARMFSSLEDDIVAKSNGKEGQSRSLKLTRELLPSRWAFRFAQWRSERRSYTQRLSVLRSDRWLEESLSFTER